MKYLFVFVFISVQCVAQTSSKTNDPILSGHPISFYMAHKEIPQICKDVYTGVRQPSDEVDVLSLLDSIFTKNKETAPFYFLTITRTMEKADGAYAEPLGMMGKHFVETRTKQFIDYFENESLLTSHDFNEWASTVSGEIEILSDNEEQEFDKMKEKVKSNCASCNAKQLQRMNAFLEKVKESTPSK
jgi:hypothetical protein